ncbi:MAG: hypothetical protein A2Z99_15640 [Treponema sp. GWB1_62_6]|nr:MAG: hypothetical protein A2Z99_15640 [Treponema sp. GWB1_62_6]
MCCARRALGWAAAVRVRRMRRWPRPWAWNGPRAGECEIGNLTGITGDEAEDEPGEDEHEIGDGIGRSIGDVAPATEAAMKLEQGEGLFVGHKGEKSYTAEERRAQRREEKKDWGMGNGRMGEIGLLRRSASVALVEPNAESVEFILFANLGANGT